MKTSVWLLAIAATMSGPAYAQQACTSVDRILSEITGPKYSETGMLEMMAGQARMQIYSNPATGSWTLISLLPNGMACILGAGNSIEPMGKAAKMDNKS